MSHEEVGAQVNKCVGLKLGTTLNCSLQMKVLLLAGYETTSSTFRLFTRSLPEVLTRCFLLAVLSWVLLELAKHPAIQTKLREELLAFSLEPTYDQLTNNLPYLDAVVHETLRLDSPITEFIRIVRSLRFYPHLLTSFEPLRRRRTT